MNEITDIGKELVGYAKDEAAFTAQRGLLDDLFPFIYVASKRMSLRAICRWFEERHRIQISPNAVSKAMRNQEAYWAQIADDVAASARSFADAYDLDPDVVLQHKDYFLNYEGSTPKNLSASNHEELERELRRLATAAGVIRNRWFALPEEAREQCYRHFAGEFGEVAEDRQEGEMNESK